MLNLFGLIGRKKPCDLLPLLQQACCPNLKRPAESAVTQDWSSPNVAALLTACKLTHAKQCVSTEGVHFCVCGTLLLTLEIKETKVWVDTVYVRLCTELWKY